MNIGATVKKLRDKKNITQQELGESIGATQAMIAQIERGTRVLSLPLAVEVAKALGVTLDDLVA